MNKKFSAKDYCDMLSTGSSDQKSESVSSGRAPNVFRKVKNSTKAKSKKIHHETEDAFLKSNNVTRNKLDEIESFKFFLFIATNAELLSRYVFESKNQKKSSVLNGFYITMKSF